MFFSCSQKEYFDEIVKPKRGGVYRGMYFNYTQKEVLNTEKGLHPYNVSENDIDYKIDLSARDSLKIFYNFNNGYLYKIDSEIHISKSILRKNVFNKILKFYSNKLGEPTVSEKKYYTWQLSENHYLTSINFVLTNSEEKEILLSIYK